MHYDAIFLLFLDDPLNRSESPPNDDDDDDDDDGNDDNIDGDDGEDDIVDCNGVYCLFVILVLLFFPSISHALSLSLSIFYVCILEETPPPFGNFFLSFFFLIKKKKKKKKLYQWLTSKSWPYTPRLIQRLAESLRFQSV